MMDERGGFYLLWRISTLKLEILQTNHSGGTHRTIGPDDSEHVDQAAQDYIANPAYNSGSTGLYGQSGI
jgi:hypothetical protein